MKRVKITPSVASRCNKSFVDLNLYLTDYCLGYYIGVYFVYFYIISLHISRIIIHYLSTLLWNDCKQRCKLVQCLNPLGTGNCYDTIHRISSSWSTSYLLWIACLQHCLEILNLMIRDFYKILKKCLLGSACVKMASASSNFQSASKRLIWNVFSVIIYIILNNVYHKYHFIIIIVSCKPFYVCVRV